MARKKNRNTEIRRMLQMGATYEEVGNKYGISKGRVAQIVKENKMRVDSVAIRDEELSRELVKSDLNIQNNIVEIFQMQKTLLKQLNDAIDGDDETLERLRELGSNDIVSAFQKSSKDAVAAMESYAKIYKIGFDIDHVKNFKASIIEAIKEVCSEEQTRLIIKKLQEDKPLEQAIKGG